jgi:1-acyl-sn-glycerol-3-phosphate acyltransferase
MESPCTALIAKENYRYPIWKSMLKRWDAIPIDRSNKQAAIESVKAAEEFLKTGMNVIILPEGTRTITGNLSRFKKGGFHMAYNTKIPIVPIGCIGAFEFKPKNRWTLSPRTITVNFGDPMDPDSYDQLGVEGILKKTEEEIKRLSNGKFEDE